MSFFIGYSKAYHYLLHTYMKVYGLNSLQPIHQVVATYFTHRHFMK